MIDLPKNPDTIVTPPSKFHNGDRVMLNPGIFHPMAGRAGTVGSVRDSGHDEACYIVYDLGGEIKSFWFYADNITNMLYNPDGDGFYRVKDVRFERMTVAERSTDLKGRVYWEVLGRDGECFTDEVFQKHFVLYEKLAIGG